MKDQNVPGVEPVKKVSVRQGGSGKNLSLLERLAKSGSKAASYAIKKYKRW